jgi:hypothetical protein
MENLIQFGSATCTREIRKEIEALGPFPAQRAPVPVHFLNPRKIWFHLQFPPMPCIVAQMGISGTRVAHAKIPGNA